MIRVVMSADALHDLSLALAAELSPARVLEILLQTLIERTDARRGFVMLRESKGFSVRLAREIEGDELRETQRLVSDTILDKMAAEGRAVLYDDASGDIELSHARSVQRQRVKSVLAVPLMVRRNLLGAIYLDHPGKTGAFDADAVALVERLAAHAALALRNAREIESAHRERDLKDEELKSARRQLKEVSGFDRLVGKGEAMQEVFRVLERVADIDYPVLIEGESGTGKELAARAIHFRGRRADNPFIPVNCGAMPEQLLASELFGHERGAFTGADRSRPGLFETAHGGTLFLDEIETMSPALQESLLRVLESGEVRPLGGPRAITVSVRVLAATNVELETIAGFRQDLMYRLAVMRVKLPPLRRRRDDIPLLVDHFLGEISRELKSEKKSLTPAAMKILVEHPWPGNVRQLQNALKRAAALTDKPQLCETDLLFLKSAPAPVNVVTVDDYILKTYEQLRGSMDLDAIADRLGISRKSLWEKRRSREPE